MSELPLDANGNPIYPEGIIEAHTAFLAHFNEEQGDGMHGRVKRGLAAALPLLKQAWEAERRNRPDYLPDTPDVEVAAFNLRTYLGAYCPDTGHGGWDDLEPAKRAPWLEAATAVARVFRDRWNINEVVRQKNDLAALETKIDKLVGFHGSPFPTLVDRVNALNMRAKAEQDGRKQAEKSLERLMAVIESFAKHADDSGWHNTAEELRRKAAEALNGVGDMPPRIVTDEMIVAAIHYLHANGLDMLNRQLLGLLNAAVGAKP